MKIGGFKVITRNDLTKAMDKAEAAKLEVRGCRQQVKNYNANLISELTYSVPCRANGTAVAILYVTTENLGTRKWGDYYQALNELNVCHYKIYETDKAFNLYSEGGTKSTIRKSQIVAIVKG